MRLANLLFRRPGFVHVCSRATAEAKGIVPFAVGARKFLLVADGGEFRACERFCPHQMADLAGGRCEGGKLLCPRHDARFDLTTGEAFAGWSIPRLRTIPVQVHGRHLYVAKNACG